MACFTEHRRRAIESCRGATSRIQPLRKVSGAATDLQRAPRIAKGFKEISQQGTFRFVDAPAAWRCVPVLVSGGLLLEYLPKTIAEWSYPVSVDGVGLR